MKKRRLLSLLLAIVMVTALLPLGLLTVAAEGVSAGELPTALPGDPNTVYKWGHYPDANGKYDFWYGTQLGTLGTGNGTPEETWAKPFLLNEIVAPNTAIVAGESYVKDFDALDYKISEKATGLMFKVKTGAEWTGFKVLLNIDGLKYAYTSSGNGTYKGQPYHYDYASQTWKVEATAGSNARLPKNYDGYIYVPFNGFSISGPVSDKTLEDNMSELVEQGISKITFQTAAWTAGATITLESVGVVTLSDRLLSAAPVLTDGINLAIRAGVHAGAKSASVTFDIEGKGSETVTIENPVAGENRFVLTEALMAQDLTRKIDITLTIDGVVCDTVEDYTIRGYCMNMLKKESTSKALKVLLADLLAYGAGAQTYTSTNTGDLANALMTTLQKSYTSATPNAASIASTKRVENSGDAACDWKTAALSLNSLFSLRMTFAATTIENMVVRVNETYDFTPYKTETEGVYEVRIDGVITAKLLNDALKYQLVNKTTGVAVGEILYYSANDYIKSHLSNASATAANKTIVGLVYNYGVSAEAYAATITLTNDYVIVLPEGFVDDPNDATDNADPAELASAASSFRAALADKTGLSLATASSTAAKRIQVTMVGANTKTGYEVYVDGETVYVDVYDIAQLAPAFDALLGQISVAGKISAGLDVVAGAPVYSYAGTMNAHVYKAGNESNMMYISGATAAGFDSYCAKLEAMDYELYTENRMGEAGKQSVFATYRNENRTIYVTWNPVDKFIRVTDSPAYYYVPDGSADDYVAITDTFLAQIRRADVIHSYGAVGLGLIWQLADGRFIMVDGGPNYNGTDAESPYDDVQLTYDFLMAHKPVSHEKPIIAAWFFTHEHGDHTWLGRDFITKHHADVEVQMLAQNFPDFQETMYRGTSYDCTPYIRQFFPDATIWVMRAGQKVRIADAEIEVIFSHEDFYPGQFYPNGYVSTNDPTNYSDCVFRVTVAGVSTMVLGDSEGKQTVNSAGAAVTGKPDLANDYMPHWYGSYLKCDILQTAHHGINEGLLLYQAVDPSIAIWPTSSWASCNQWRAANRWLYSGVAYNGKTSNVKAHYFSNVDTILTLAKCPTDIELPMTPLS